MDAERCSWCGAEVGTGDGYRAFEPAGAAGALPAGELRDGLPARCAECDGPLGDAGILAVRHRGEHRIADGFCSAEHLRAWAAAGGRWR
ncbi:MAG: hypothetical protein MUF56_03335 [Solirubrobacteraceae bacterium]|nr:hypothetical protein [Solirubrobacteraceae bacterium]